MAYVHDHYVKLVHFVEWESLSNILQVLEYCKREVVVFLVPLLLFVEFWKWWVVVGIFFLFVWFFLGFICVCAYDFEIIASVKEIQSN